MTWPPADTFRNRFLYVAAAGTGALVTVYFLLFALQTRGFLPWAIFTLALAATVVAGLGLALMQAARTAAATPGSDPAVQDTGVQDTGVQDPGGDPTRIGPAGTTPGPADPAALRRHRA